MLGTEPTVIRQWLPSTTLPSVSSTRTPPDVRVTPAARPRRMCIPRRSNTVWSSSAASLSSPGSTRSRLDTSVTDDPIAL